MLLHTVHQSAAYLRSLSWCSFVFCVLPITNCILYGIGHIMLYVYRIVVISLIGKSRRMGHSDDLTMGGREVAVGESEKRRKT